MYKDPDKQRQASKRAMRRHRAKGTTQNKDVIPEVDSDVIPKCWCCGADIPIGTVCCGPCAWSGRAKANRAGATPPVLTEPKRGADIKVFADLPPDVQATIDRLGETNTISRAMRIANAIHYQHLYPDSYYSTGIQ